MQHTKSKPKQPHRRRIPAGLVGIDDAAEILGVHRVTVYGWVKEGRIPRVPLPGGRAIFFDPEKLREWVRSEEKEAGEADKKSVPVGQ